jgi:SPP1 gp7 family putative phage head morphogenesis protein
VTKPVVRRPRPVTKVVAANPIELKPVRPAAATRARYQKALDAAVTEMHRSILYWIGANYKRNTPEIMALDASPARELRAALRKLARRWQANFDRLAPRLAEYFATSVSDRVDGQLDRMLRDAGFTVRFKMTRAQNDAMQATIGENVSLIKSVAGKYLTDIEGDVMRSVQEGRDLAGLTEALTNTYGVTRRRAETIARSQNNMATATITRVRQKELGITKARWLHSAGGRTPRPEHVEFSGQLYDIDKGAFLEGEWTWPGRAINCRCVSVPVIPGFEP